MDACVRLCCVCSGHNVVRAMRTMRWSARCACRTLMFACCQTSFIAIRKPLYNLNYLKNCKNVLTNFYFTHFSSYLLRSWLARPMPRNSWFLLFLSVANVMSSTVGFAARLGVRVLRFAVGTAADRTHLLHVGAGKTTRINTKFNDENLNDFIRTIALFIALMNGKWTQEDFCVIGFSVFEIKLISLRPKKKEN